MRDIETSANQKRGNPVTYAIIAALILIGVLALLIYDSNYNLEVEEFVVPLEGLPEEFEGFRIVHLSDLHGAEFGTDNVKLLNIIKSAKPDIIAITGDIVENRNDISELQKSVSDIAKIAPTYYVSGNHEYATGKSSVIFRILQDAGVTVLRNQTSLIRRLDSEIIILGIDDPNGRADMIEMGKTVTLARKKSDSVMIALSHRYERFEEYVELRIPLVLTGHAHGGLIRLPFTDGLIGPGRVFLPKYTSGMYVKNDTIMITSRGIGNASISFRIFNRPHIPIITLECRNSE